MVVLLRKYPIIFRHLHRFHESLNCDDNEKVTITIRDTSARNKHMFKSQLTNHNWENMQKHSNPNEAYDCFINEYTQIMNKCLPLKTIKGKRIWRLKKPWITRGLFTSIKTKNKLLN